MCDDKDCNKHKRQKQLKLPNELKFKEHESLEKSETFKEEEKIYRHEGLKASDDPNESSNPTYNQDILTQSYTSEHQKKLAEQEIKHGDADVEDHENRVRHREKYTKLLVWGTGLWLLLVLLIIMLQGFGSTGAFVKNHKTWFELDDSVLLMLLGTTTANIIAVLMAVVNFLFPKNKSKQNNQKSSKTSKKKTPKSKKSKKNK